MVKQHQERKYHMFKRFYIIAAAALYFGCSLWTGLRADDAAIYVNKVPSAETPNVLFTIDTSGSMDTVVPNGTQTRIEAVKSALTDLVTTTSNLKAGLERFHYELGAPIVFPVVNLDSAPDFLNGSVSVSSIDRSSDDAAERNSQVYLDDRSLNLTQIQTGGNATIETLEVTPLASNDDDEAGTAGNETLTSPDLDVGQTNAGVRFPGVTIPRNATILHAEVEFRENSGHNEDTDLRISGHNVSNSPAFTETGANSVTSRFSAQTNARVDWSNVSPLSAGQYVTTPNVRNIIQEIVNRSDWPTAGGNPITLLFESLGGHRELSTVDGPAAPVLRIEYVDSGTKVQQQVQDSNDDANEDSGANPTTNSKVFSMLHHDNGNSVYSHAGVLFRNVDIPDGAVVVWSDIAFTTDSERLSAPVDLVIKGILSPSLGGFSNGNRISTQPLTTSTVDWVGDLSEGDEEIFTPNDGETLWTPDLAPLVEEMRANTSFQNGDTLGFVFTDPDGGAVNDRQACSFDGAQNAGKKGCPEGVGKPTLNVFYAFPTGATTLRQDVGLRFNNVQVPQGATITSASLEFTVDAATTDPGNLTIAIEDSTSPQTYSNDSGQKISDRAYGTSTIWTTDTWDMIGDTKQSVDISSLVSSVTGKTGWCGGGSLAFRITSADANLIAQAFDKGASGAPTLRVAYKTDALGSGEGCTTRQTSVSINDQRNDSEEAKYNLGGWGQNRYNKGDIDLYSSDLDLDDQWLVGLRFENVDVPAGATITSANLYMSSASFDSGEDKVLINVQQHPNAPSFSNGRYDLSNRVSDTVAPVTWDITNDWNQNGIYSTQDDGTDLTSLLQPIIDGDVTVNGAAWASGNALALILDGGQQGSQNRRGASCCGFPLPARLDISYQINLGDQPNQGQITGRDALLSIVNDLVASGFTPPVDALYEAGAYFAGEAVHFGRTRGAGQSYEPSGPTDEGIYTSDLDSNLIRFGQPLTDAELLREGDRSRLSHPATYGGGVDIIREGNCTATDPNNRDCRTEHMANNENATYVSPFSTAQACEKGFLVLLSDGIANRNSSRDLIKTLTGRTSCPMRIPQIDSSGNVIINSGSFSFRDPTSDEQCGLELADYLQKTDFITEADPATDVLNNVRTFTIGFNLPVANSTENRRAVEFLKALAFVGNGGDLNNPNGVPDLNYGPAQRCIQDHRQRDQQGNHVVRGSRYIDQRLQPPVQLERYLFQPFPSG
jgi:type IV pilus assembly protein PilY1